MNVKLLSRSVSDVIGFTSWLESRLDSIETMTVPSEDDLQKYVEFEADTERLGVRFFRGFAHVANPEQARALTRDALDGFLGVLTYSLGKVLAKNKALALVPTPKNLARHLSNSFPQLQSCGTTLRRGVGTAKPSKTFMGCPTNETTVELDDGENWSFRLSWKYAAADDVTNETETANLAGYQDSETDSTETDSTETETDKGVQIFVEPPQQTGFSPRDSGFTGEYLRKQVVTAYQRGFADALYSVFGATPVDVTSKGLSTHEIDVVISLSFPTAPKPSSRKIKTVA